MSHHPLPYTCFVEGCIHHINPTGAKIWTRPQCDLHTCHHGEGETRCLERVSNGFRYCSKHQSKECDIPFCTYKHIKKGGFCKKHTCHYPDCIMSFHSKKSKFCWVHAQIMDILP